MRSIARGSVSTKRGQAQLFRHARNRTTPTSNSRSSHHCALSDPLMLVEIPALLRVQRDSEGVSSSRWSSAPPRFVEGVARASCIRSRAGAAWHTLRSGEIQELRLSRPTGRFNRSSWRQSQPGVRGRPWWPSELFACQRGNNWILGTFSLARFCRRRDPPSSA